MKYMVGAMFSSDFDLKIELIEGKNWKEALSKHSRMVDENGNPDDNSWMPDDIEEAKQTALNADLFFDVFELGE